MSGRCAIARVLLALDATPVETRQLEASARLAALLSAELSALFVEDADLLHLAALPFARAFDPSSAGSHEIRDPAEMELQWRVQQAHARGRLEALAAARHVRCSFRVTRARRHVALEEAAGASDLLVLGSSGRPGPATAGPDRIAVAFDASAGSRRALETGLQLLDGHEGLTVFVDLEDPAALASLGELLPPDESVRARIRVQRLRGLDLARLRRAVSEDAGGRILLLLASSNPLARELVHRPPLSPLPCSIGLVA